MPEQTGNLREAETEKEIEMGLDFARKGDLEHALGAFTRAIELDEDRWEAFRYRGITYAKMGLQDAALSDFDTVIEKNPACAGCFFERANAGMFAGHLADALKDLSECLRLDTHYAPAYSVRAGIYARKGYLQEALEDINSALRIRPGSPEYLHNRAVIMTGLERYGDAIKDYLRVIELDPLSGGSYNNIAWLLATAKDPRYRDCRKAIFFAEKALEIGKNGAWMDTLAAAYAECGAFKEAIRIEKEAYRKSNPPNRNFEKRIEIYKNGLSYSQWRENDRMSGGGM